jgi:predicted unusual protein kinase regulating ubiquinone biosynthesis (AarF/ABC1/UbiB family)
LIREELGVPLEDVFSEISLEPIAAASLGQVYKARLRSTGELVAVKVQRPGIGDSIALDMFLVRKAAAWADVNTEISRSTPLVNIVDEFASRLFAELDYIKEGRNAERFDKLYGSLPRIRVPKIIWEYTSRRVLTMEWIEGVKLTDERGLRGYGMRAVDFVDLGVDCTMRQLLEHGYFHADPHPGNILATRAGELVYLDFGMMSEAPLSARYGIMAHVVHLVNREYGAMARDYYTLGFLDRSVDVAPLVPELANFFDDVLNKSVSELNLKSIIDGLADVLYRFPFQVPAYYALIARSLTVLEGIAMRSDPSYRLIARAYPYIAKRLLTDEAEELRGALEEFLIQNGSFRWARLEDLINEGRKVGGIREEQLWSFLHWLVSEQKAFGVRGALVHDLIPIIEAVGLSATRSAAASIAGIMRISREEADALVDRAIPLRLSERQALQRASLLQGIGGTAASSSAPPTKKEEEQRGRAPWDIPAEIISSVQGSVDGVRQQIERTRGQFDRTLPELQRLLESPNLTEMANEIGRGLLTRLSARALKIILREEDEPKKDEMR